MCNCAWVLEISTLFWLLFHENSSIFIVAEPSQTIITEQSKVDRWFVGKDSMINHLCEVLEGFTFKSFLHSKIWRSRLLKIFSKLLRTLGSKFPKLKNSQKVQKWFDWLQNRWEYNRNVLSRDPSIWSLKKSFFTVGRKLALLIRLRMLYVRFENDHNWAIESW